MLHPALPQALKPRCLQQQSCPHGCVIVLYIIIDKNNLQVVFDNKKIILKTKKSHQKIGVIYALLQKTICLLLRQEVCYIQQTQRQ
jgi:hypothetical protein